MSVDRERLVERVRRCQAADNALDIAIEIALFEPDKHHVSVRPNAAGTKLIYERHDGKTDTFWAADHTLTAARRETAITALLSLGAFQ